MTPLSPEARTARASERLARLDGRREAWAQRKTTLERTVGEAKGRLLVRKEVEQFIDEIQFEAARRQIGSFETLLSSLVADVLPGERPIVLNLTTERGMPALDICSNSETGVNEDVHHDQGGALENVVGMGLRLIAVVKSGLARFLLLDEADNWIKGTHVESFYRVLRDSTARLGVQTLVVSHHDVDMIGGEGRIIEVYGKRKVRSDVKCADPLPQWSEDAEGIRYLWLKDFQAFPDAKIDLAPGMNCVVGDNNLGKSCVTRALRAMFLGEARDSLVRHGAKEAVVDVGLAHGRYLRFSRYPKRNPINLWSLHEANGEIVDEGGIHRKTGGRDVPPWVQEAFKIKPIENIDAHLVPQKSPVFLLDKSPATRASVLSVGMESDYARDMLAIHKERVLKDQQIVRDGEREIGTISESLEKFAHLPGLSELLVVARAAAHDIATGEKRVERLELCVASVSRDIAIWRAASARLEIIERSLPDAAALTDMHQQRQTEERLAATASALNDARRSESLAAGRLAILTGLAETPTFTPVDRPVAAARQIGTLRQTCDRAGRFEAILATLPDAPEIRAEVTVVKAAEALTSQRSILSAKSIEAQALMAHEAALRREAEKLTQDFGENCPACGNHISADQLLDHSHGSHK